MTSLSLLAEASQNELKRWFDPGHFRQKYPSIAKIDATDDDIFSSYIYYAAQKTPLEPNRTFDEEFYIEKYDDVRQAVEAGILFNGFQHYTLWGKQEGRWPRDIVYGLSNDMLQLMIGIRTPGAAGGMLDRLRQHFDPTRYRSILGLGSENLDDALLFEYFIVLDFWSGIVAAKDFDEEFYLLYYQDIQKAVSEGILPSGFFHYIVAGAMEGRVGTHNLHKLLQIKLGQSAAPVGIQNLESLSAKIAPLKYVRTAGMASTYNVFIPSLDPDIMFGGYIAFLNFLTRLAESGALIRFIICEDSQSNFAWFTANIKRSRPRWHEAFKEFECYNAARGETIEVGDKDSFIAYSCWTMHNMWSVASTQEYSSPIFFIQEFEPIFHSYDSFHFLASSSYAIPHTAIFNTDILRDYFKTRCIGVFSPDNPGRHFTFQHALANVTPNEKAMLSRVGRKRRLIFYARPEAHAARNLFEIGIFALREAVAQGIFGDEWEFFGIGTLGATYEIALGGTHSITLNSRIEQGQYEAMIQSFDVALSLMWAPHPSVFPFEMANAGVVTVVNAFESRSQMQMEQYGHNIVPCDATLNGIVSGLAEAVKRVENISARLSANLNWPTDWDAVFNPDFIAEIRELHSDNHVKE